MESFVKIENININNASIISMGLMFGITISIVPAIIYVVLRRKRK